jgi:hypothetical protein
LRQTNYPETLHRFYVINTPWVFQGIYKIAERFLDPVVKSKVWPYLPPVHLWHAVCSLVT